MSIKFHASQETVKWISRTRLHPDLYSWSNFQDEDKSYINPKFSRIFTYTKTDYRHLDFLLPYMMIEHLLICPCDPWTTNQY